MSIVWCSSPAVTMANLVYCSDVLSSQHETTPSALGTTGIYRMSHFHSSAFVILLRQHAALNGNADIEIHWSAYEQLILPCAIAPTLKTTGPPSEGSDSTNSLRGTTLGELCENAIRVQPAGKYFVTGPLIT